MKHIYFNKTLFLFFCIAAALLATGCIREDLDACPPAYKVTLKVLNNNGEEITAAGDVSRTTLFIFDENNQYLDQIKLDKDFIVNKKNIELNYPGHNKLNILGWGNLSEEKETVAPLTKGDNISKFQLQLKTDNAIALHPDSLYQGTQVIYLTGTESNKDQEIAIVPKSSQVSIMTYGLLEEGIVTKAEGGSPDDLQYFLYSAENVVDYEGNPVEGEVSYSPDAKFNDENVFTAPYSNTFPFQDVSVALNLKDQEVTSRIDHDDDGRKLTVPPGQQLLIVMRIKDGKVSVKTKIVPWGYVEDNIEL